MKDDAVYIHHIIECIESIREYTRSGEAEFFRSRLIQDAVIRNLEIIGEASKKVSQGLRNRSIEVPWKEMAGLRDVLIHNYFGVDLRIVWNVVIKELPEIHKQLIDIL